MCRTHTQTTISIPTTTTQEIKSTEQNRPPPPHIELTIDTTTAPNAITHDQTLKTIKSITLPLISNLHAGYFRITLSLCWQTLLWKTLVNPPQNAHAYRKMLTIPYAAFTLIWFLSFFILASLSILYILRCVLLFNMVKEYEYLNPINVNYLFAPWISWLLLLQSSVLSPATVYHHALWLILIVPILILDVKIYGQWFTKGKRFLSTAANPASQLSVIGNFVGARVASEMGWRECGIIMFTLGFVHYVVLFITLYQRLTETSCMPAMLRPVMFMFIAAPSMGSLAWGSISGTFDCSSKMLFYLSVFLFLCLVSRPVLFKKSMRRFSVVWWAYSYPLTVLALGSVEYAQEMRTTMAHLVMVVCLGLSVLVSFVLMVCTALNTNTYLLPRDGD